MSDQGSPGSFAVRRLVPSLGAATFLVGSGLWVGFLADSHRVSAMLLLLEPALDLLCVLLAYFFWVRGRGALAVGFLLGILGNFMVVRLPWSPPPPMPVPEQVPDWLKPVQNCLPSVGWPQDGLRILQWTVDGHRDPEEILEVVAALQPDLFLLSGTDDRDLAVRLHADLGGEYQLQTSDRDFGGRLVFARGTFHICGESSEWVQGGTHLSFAGITPDTIVPFFGTWHPGPLDAPDWARQRAQWAEDLLMLQRLQSPATVLAVDAPALATWRYLQAGLRDVGLSAAPSPPNWPVHLLGLPMVPLHPLDRLWVGPGWSVTAARRVRVRGGGRAPVLTSLEPASNTALRPRLSHVPS